MKFYILIGVLILLCGCVSKEFLRKERQSWSIAKMKEDRVEFALESENISQGKKSTPPTKAQKPKPSKVEKVESRGSASESSKKQQLEKPPVKTEKPKPSEAEKVESYNTTLATPQNPQLAKHYKKPLKPKTNKIGIEALITEKDWNIIFPNRYGIKDKQDFFTYEALVMAASKFPAFLNEGSIEKRQQELAAFLAHIAQETSELRYKEQLNVKKNYSVKHADYAPVRGKDYHGRGPIQLSYNYNYGQFSLDYFGDKLVLLQDPDRLCSDAVIAFASAIWFWMKPQPPKPSCHEAILGTYKPTPADIAAKRFPGFGLTLNIINAPQCGCKPTEHVQNRYNFYAQYCRIFGISLGENVTCTQQVPYGKK